MGAKLTLAQGILHSKRTGRPYMLSHLLTNRCNLDCPFCIWKRNTADGMTTEQIVRLHREAKELGFRGVFFWGGEPLLRKDILEILEHAKSLGWFVNMATNGTLLPMRAKRIAPLLDSILVSIDHPDDHDAIRGVEGTLDACLKGLRLLKQANPKLHRIIATVLTKHNWAQMRSLARLAKREGCLLLVQQMDHGTTYIGKTNHAEDVTQDQRDVALDELVKLKKEGYPIMNSFTYLRQFRSPARSFSCRCQRMYLTVDAEGNVMDCTQRIPIASVSNGLKAVLESPEYRSFRKAADKCSHCSDAGTLENTFLYNLRFEPLLNIFKHSLREH